MSSNVAFIPEYGIVSVSISGLNSLAELLNVVHKAITLGAKEGSIRLLLDAQDFHWRLSKRDIVVLHRVLEDVGMTTLHKQAVISDKGEIVAKYYEMIFRNRGFQVRVFQEMGSAIDWLQETSDRNHMKTRELK